MTTLSASLDIIDLSDGVLTKSAEGQRTIVTEDAAPLPLLTLAPVIGESVQDGTPTPSAPVYIQAVRPPARYLHGDDLAGTDYEQWKIYGNTSRVLRSDGLYESVTAAMWAGVCITFKGNVSLNVGDKFCISVDVRNPNSSAGTIICYSMESNSGGTRVYTANPLGENGGSSSAVLGTLAAGATTRVSVKCKWTQTCQDLIDAGGQVNLTFQTTTSGVFLVFYKPMLQMYTSITPSSCYGQYVPYGHIGVICSNGNTTYIDLKGNELHGLNATYYDQLDIDASGHAMIKKRTFSRHLTGAFDEDWSVQGSYASIGGGFYSLNNSSITGYNSSNYSYRNISLTASNTKFSHGTVVNMGSSADATGVIGIANGNTYTHFRMYEESAHNLANWKTWLASNPLDVVLPLHSDMWYTIDLGYVDLPEITDGSTVYVAAEIQPVIGGSWWTQAGLAAGEAFKDNRDEDWASRLMVTNAQMAIDKINGQIQTLVSGLDGMTTLTQTDSGFEFTVDDSLTSLLNGLQTDYNSLIHDLGVVVGNHTTELGVLSNYVQVTTENNQPVLRLGSSSNPIVAVLTNTGLEFRQSENGTESIVAYLAVDDDGRGKLKVNTAVVLDTLQFGNWEWYTRPNGNMSIRWIGE